MLKPLHCLLLASVCLPPPVLGCRADDPELEVLVERLLPRIEARSGLEALAPVRVARRDSAELRDYLADRIETELDEEEVAGIQATYQALGLLPEALDLRELLFELYSEQVVGLYDPGTSTLYVMEGVSTEALEPVLTHELVHALQDQHVHLDSLIARERGNDRQLAAHAALEGHATLVMFELLIEGQLGRELDIRDLPDLREQVRPLLETGHEQFPVFQAAPRLIRESLLFPYIEGAGFVQRLWRELERRPPLGQLLPLSTAQVLWPDEHYFPEPAPPLEVEFRVEPPSGWRTLRENTIGAFEIRLLLEEHLGSGRGDVARDWRGDAYRTLAREAGGRALVWLSVWRDAEAADAFAQAYREVLAGRSTRRGLVERRDLDGHEAVLVIDADEGLDPLTVPAEAVRMREGVFR